MMKASYWCYLILAARVLLAWTMLRYGWSKLTDNQFGVDLKTMEMPLKNIDLFRLSWYLADHQPFKSFIGLSQISTGLLLLVNRTAIVGAFISIPIWLNILIWDMTFMQGMAIAFTFRLSYYLLLTGLIIYQRKANVLSALRNISQSEPRISYPICVYFTLPVAAICLELVGAIPNAVVALFRLLV